MTDIAHFGADDDIAFARQLVTDVGVAAVPGSSFYHDPKTASLMTLLFLKHYLKPIDG